MDLSELIAAHQSPSYSQRRLPWLKPRCLYSLRCPPLSSPPSLSPLQAGKVLFDAVTFKIIFLENGYGYLCVLIYFKHYFCLFGSLKTIPSRAQINEIMMFFESLKTTPSRAHIMMGYMVVVLVDMNRW